MLLVRVVLCCPATVYAVLLWLYLLSAFGKLNTYIHKYISHQRGMITYLLLSRKCQKALVLSNVLEKDGHETLKPEIETETLASPAETRLRRLYVTRHHQDVKISLGVHVKINFTCNRKRTRQNHDVTLST